MKKQTELVIVDLLSKYAQGQAEGYRQGALKHVTKITNETLNAKAGDTVEFLNGFDIPMKTEIVGFDNDGDLYLVWDCYWFPLKQERITKIISN